MLAALTAAFIAVYAFAVPFNTLLTVALIGGFAWMHLGMHGSHDGHGAPQEHAGHTAEAARRDNPTDSIVETAPGRAAQAPVQAVAEPQSTRRGG